MRFLKKVKYFGAFALMIALLSYLTYTGITGYLTKEIVNIPIVQELNNPQNPQKQTVDIQNQADSDTQKAVDKFMQEFNIPITKRDEFIKQAKDVIKNLDNPEYQIVPPEKKEIPPESLNQCFERVITECS